MSSTNDLLQQAQKLFDQKEYQKVIDLLTDGVLNNAKSAELFTWRAWSYIRLRKDDDAIAYADKALNEDPYCARAYRVRGTANYNKNNIDQALDDLNKSIGIDQKDRFAYINRGLTWHSKKQNVKAIADYTKAIDMTMDGGEPDLLLYRATACAEIKDYNQAFLDFDKVIAAEPENDKAFFARGLAWEKKGDADKAIADYSSAIQINSQNTSALNNRGIQWYNKKEYDKAIADYDKALEADDKFVLAYANRADCYAAINEDEKALADYQKALSLDKNNFVTLFKLGLYWASKNDYDKAIDAYTRASNAEPANASPVFYRGNANYLKAKYKEAIEDYTKAIALGTDDGYAQANRGLAYQFLEQNEEALSDFKLAIKLLVNDHDRNDIISFFDNLSEKVEEEKLWQRAIEVIDSGQKDKINNYQNIKHFPSALKLVVEQILSIANKVDNQTTVHYTKLFVADKILEKAEKDKQGRLRYYNAIYMNDPEEGEFFLNCFNHDEDRSEKDTNSVATRNDNERTNYEKIKHAYYSGRKNNENSVYLGSFLVNSDDDKNKHEDELVMWRTYGKGPNQVEAAGCSLVIDKQFFDAPDDSKGKLFNKDGVSTSQILYNVVYYKSGSYKIDGDNPEIKTTMADLELVLLNMANLKTCLKMDDEGKAKEAVKIIDGFIFNYLSRISYLFKSADYAFEHEVRVVIYVPRGSALIQVDKPEESYPPKLYIPSKKSLVPYLKKIFIGPKAQNPEHWSAYLDLRFRQRKSENPADIKNNPQILNSECRFR